MLPTVAPTRDLAACRVLRRTVFIEEQGVSDTDEVDGRDDEAIHLLATLDGKPIGTARLLVHDGVCKVGRVCVLREVRGQGIGAALIRAAIAEARGMAEVHTVKLGAQTHALGFYERLGFAAYGPIYLDAGIEHRDMTLAL